MYTCNMRKQRVETYLERDTIEALTQAAQEYDISSSQFIREAVKQKLQREVKE